MELNGHLNLIFGLVFGISTSCTSGGTLYRVSHIKCYRAIGLKLFIISKNFSDKSFSVREGRHTRQPYFVISGGAEAMSRSTTLFKMEPCIFFQ